MSIKSERVRHAEINLRSDSDKTYFTMLKEQELAILAKEAGVSIFSKPAPVGIYYTIINFTI